MLNAEVLLLLCV